MWGMDSVCDLRARVSRRGGVAQQIEFTDQGGWVILEIRKMKRMTHDSNALGRRLRACVCLMAVMLLWAPAWGAALQAAGVGCCDGAMCPLHGHAPKKS